MLSEFFSAIWVYWGWFAHTYIKPYHEEILAVAIIVIAIYTAILAIVARRQTRETRILQRAYLSVRPGGIHILTNRSEAVPHVEICNAGNLPATNTKWFIKHDFVWDGDWKIGGISPRGLVRGGNIIAPHAKMRQGGDPIAVGSDALRHQEGLYLYVWGAVTYYDGFRRRRRITTFCHRYNCVNVRHNLEGGFVAMGGTTARDHREGNSAN